MSDIIYSNSLAIAWVVLFIFAFVLFFGKVPQTDIFRPYNRTRKILSVALALWGVHILLQLHFNFRTEAPHIATALCISLYYMEAILFGMAYISLLDATYISKRQMRHDFTRWGMVCVVVWSATFFLQGVARSVALIAAATFFLTEAVRISRTFFITYNNAVREIENYYSENTDAFIRWIYRSTLGIVFFGVIGAPMAFAPKWAVGVYMSAGICMFVYIFLSLLNYSLNCEKVGVAVTEPLPQVSPDESETISDDDMGKRLEEWIGNGYYRNAGITMEQLTEYFGMNRNTLSEYFNRTLHVSFRDWITGLRIADAKRMMIDEPSVTMDEVARRIGFSGKSYFSTVFKRCEKVTPSEWRKKQEK